MCPKKAGFSAFLKYMKISIGQAKLKNMCVSEVGLVFYFLK